MLSMSLAAPNPAWKRVSDFLSQSVPSRQGMHQPQLSCSIKADGAKRELNDAGLVVDHHDAARAKHGAGFAHLVEVHAEVFNLFRQQHRSRRAARNHSLELAPAAHAAANFVDHLLEVVAHGQFVDARGAQCGR